VPTIESLTIHRRSIPLKRPFVTAVRRAYTLDAVLVEVRDSDGRSGWGEAPTSWRVTGESAESVTAAVTGPLIEAVMGASTDDPDALSVALERAAVRNSSARMAVDCALYDLAARAQMVPLYRYLGGSAAKVRTDMTLSAAVTASDLAELLRIACEHVGEGFNTLKIKVGAGGDDVATLIELRNTVGADVRLRVDANQGWSPEQAVQIVQSLEDAGVGLEFVEQPVRRDDIDGLAFVTSRVQTPVVADESVWTSRDLREIVKSQAADMINIKLAKTGGLREALALSSAAREHGMGVIVGCMSEGYVGIAAAAALASAIDDGAEDKSRPHDLDGGMWLTRSDVDGGVVYNGDCVVLGDAPGTGIIGLD
jgi:L-Ala-D/L-Glu epimerase